MKIENYIMNLLARYGRVSVAGCGVFRCISEGARIENGKMLPPVTRVVFDRCNAEVDRMLVETVMKNENVDWNEACEYVKNVSIDIDEVVRRWDYLPQNFGLKTVEMPSVRIMPVKWIDVKYAAVITVAVMLNMFIPFNGTNDNLNEAGITLGSMQKIVMPVEEIPAVDAFAEENEDSVIVEDMNYAVVVASFDTREAAMRCIVEQRVPEAIDVVEKDGRYRVCGLRFAKYEEANRHIRENSLSAWVMKL